MNARLVLPPALCLAGAFLLLAPLQTRAFSKIGGVLGEGQRDVRVFDNFSDATAGDNLGPAAQFPGRTGVELAVWKAIVEWGSRPHGDGSGDPQGGNLLGSGGADFDAFWAGSADGVGTANQNVVSALGNCGGGGTLAYTETPISDGWRIRFCDEWAWDDGPGLIGGRFDIQGVMVHEYGHALGLGHSSGSATMAPSVGAGQTSIRSIEADDSLGVQCLYGVASPTKPVITATEADPVQGWITIHGQEFAAADNEVWFTSAATTATGIDPIVRVSGVVSNGTEIRVAIPAAAGPGDVMVKRPGTGGGHLSNAFPTDLIGTIGAPPPPRPDLQAVAPATIEALIPGSERTITLSGAHLDLATAVLLDGVAIDPARYTVVDASTILLDMPQAASLGSHVLEVTDGVQTDGTTATIVAPPAPRLELGTGDALNVVDKDDGLSFLLSGTVGSVHHVYSSRSSLPSSNRFVALDLGNSFTQLKKVGSYTIPASGWLRVDLAPGALRDPGPLGKTLYAQSFELRFPIPFPASNLQSIVLVQ